MTLLFGNYRHSARIPAIRCWRLLVVGFLVLGSITNPLAYARDPLAQEESRPQELEPDSNPDRNAVLQMFLKEAQKYELTLLGTRPIRLDLVQQPVMHWNGSAFIWVNNGHPEAIGTFWTGRDSRTGKSRWQHAFHSLSEYSIAANFDGQLIWNPRTNGLQFRAVDGAEVPADKPWQRLAQMRALARQFSVTGIYPRYESSRRTLRLLPQPIFRYESRSDSPQDGAVFVYSADVVATDPDALLVLEARQVDGRLRWEYAFARFHYIELTGYHGDQEVWKVENTSELSRQHRFGRDPDRDSIYYSVAAP